MALYTAVPGILAYAIRDGIPIVAQLFSSEGPEYPGAVTVILDALVLLPAFGLVYAVGVAHVLGPRVVLRRSLQYALANRTLTVLIFLPAIALAFSLVQERDRTLAEIASSSSGALRAPHRRLGRDLHESRARAAVARPAVLSRRVRRAEDPAVPREPGPLRDRPGRSGDDGRQSARRGAAPADDRDPRERDRRGPVVARHRAARQRRVVAARGRPGVDAAMVGRAARDRAERSAVTGAAPAARGARVARVHGRGAARAGRRRRIARSSR